MVTLIYQQVIHNKENHPSLDSRSIFTKPSPVNAVPVAVLESDNDMELLTMQAKLPEQQLLVFTTRLPDFETRVYNSTHNDFIVSIKIHFRLFIKFHTF